MDDRRLTEIAVEVAGQLVRKYQFTYQSVANIDLFKAGRHNLLSITQMGADGLSQLPAMTFAYNELQTDACVSSGNQTAYRDRLTQANSGFGGRVSFVFTEFPSSCGQDAFSRQIVTLKHIVPDISPVQTTSYTYADGPHYNDQYPNDPRAEYRGFGDVTETDSAGNYVKHYFFTKGIKSLQSPFGGPSVDYDGDKLTGREYDTQHYNSAGALLSRDWRKWAFWDINLWQGQTYHIYSSEDVRVDGNKYSRVLYYYDQTDFGNPWRIDDYGEVTSSGGDMVPSDTVTTFMDYSHNTTPHILSRPYSKLVYSAGTYVSQTHYYYDGYNVEEYLGNPPVKGNLTRVQEFIQPFGAWVYTLYTYDSYGNRLTDRDFKGGLTSYVYDSVHHAYPVQVTYPITGLVETATWDYGSGKPLTVTDINGQATAYEYDTFKRLTKVIEPGDTSGSPSIEYRYNSWGTINQQNLETLTKVSGTETLWSKQLFDGIGRVVQVQSKGETEGAVTYTIIEGTTAYNNRGLVDKEYVAQKLDSTTVSGYKTPDAGWKYASYAYDGLGRVTTITGADGTTVSHSYTGWQDEVTNQRGYKKRYIEDAFGRLAKVEELDASGGLYSTTTYSYDALDNLKQVVDNAGNTTTMTYDALGRKLTMSDPDMGAWTYAYDNNGNLTSQTDARNTTLVFEYDALNRLTRKCAPNCTGTVLATYTYDEYNPSSGQYGKGKRTAMTDASGGSTYKFDSRGRLVIESRTVDSVQYSTAYAYDGADRLTSLTYPDGEVVTQAYNGRGLPYTLSRSTPPAPFNTAPTITSVPFTVATEGLLYYYEVDATDPNAGDTLTFSLDVAPAGMTINSTSGLIQWTPNASQIGDNNVTARVADSGGLFDTQSFVVSVQSEGGPIEVELNVQVGAGTDDAYHAPSGWPNYSDSSSMVYAGSPSSRTAWGGWRWTNLGVPAGATILEAYVELNQHEWGNTLVTTLAFEDSQSSQTFSSSSSPYHRWSNHTTFEVDWDWPAQTPDSWITTPSLLGGIQELVNSYGAIDKLALLEDGTGVPGGNYHTWKAYDGGSAFAAKLYVRYSTEAAPANDPPVITSVGETVAAEGQLYSYDVNASDPDGGEVLTFSLDVAPAGMTISSTSGLIQWTPNASQLGDNSVTARVTDPGGLFDTQSFVITVAGPLVGATTYNQLGLITQMNLGNGVRSVFGYHGLDPVDAGDSESFYGSLYRVRSYRTSDGADRIHLKHWWDGAGNLAERKNVLAVETETFAYDFLDRLTSASGPYTESYSYNQVGNMLSRNGAAYAYGSSKPHAATAVGSATYSYDANGNMTDRNGTTLAWSAENALASVSDSGGTIESYVYDGDLKRVKRVAGAQTTVYVNKYYEVTNGVATKHYYHGDRLVAVSENGTLRFVHTDHLASSSVATDTSGNQAGGRTYLPFGDQRSASGTFGTNKLYTGQRLDGTGLYFYNARYYDAAIGRFISPDTIVPEFANPQALNRYAYVYNNPLKYTDPTGHFAVIFGLIGAIGELLIPPPESPSVSDVLPPTETPSSPGQAPVEPIEPLLPLDKRGATSGGKPFGECNNPGMMGMFCGGGRGGRGPFGGEGGGGSGGKGGKTPPAPQQPTTSAAPTIRITGKGLDHIIKRHTDWGKQTAKHGTSSKFSQNIDIPRLIRSAQGGTVVRQPNGNYEFVVNASRPIGIDKNTGQPTSSYTVITYPNGELVTAFPGMPDYYYGR